MKRGLILAIATAAVLSAAFTTASCRREPIHEPFSNYYLQLEPDLDALHMKPSAPGMYEAVFYDRNTHQEVGQSYLGANGGYIYDLAPGTYEMIVYSFDSGNTKVTDLRDFTLAKASTERYEDGDTLSYNSPDHLIVAQDREFTVPFLFDREEVYYLYAYPKTIIETWCVVITGITGLTNAASIDLYITGQSRSKTLGTLEKSDVETTIHFAGRIDSSGKLIYTPFGTFGKLPDKKSTLRLVITDGNLQKIVCHADVTDQFDNPENTGHWIRANFDIHIDPKKDGGFLPDVTEWGENVFEYDIY